MDKSSPWVSTARPRALPPLAGLPMRRSGASWLRLLHAWILLSRPTPDSPAADDQNYWAKRIVHDAHAELSGLHPALRS